MWGWRYTLGIAQCGMLDHTVQVNDVISILTPAVGWVAGRHITEEFLNCVSFLVAAKWVSQLKSI